MKIIENFVALQEDLEVLYDSDGDFPSVEMCLVHLQHSKPHPQSIRKILKHIQALKKIGRYAEAAQLLLVAAATEDPVALYFLAYELNSGKVLKQNRARTFAILSKLADENFPKALCGLAKFYEHGIVVPQDKERARAYYDQAASLGVKCSAGNSLLTDLFSKLFTW